MYKKFAKSSSSSISNFSDDNNIPINKKRLHNKPNPIKTTNNIENESEQKKYQKIINSAKKNPLKYHEYTKLKYKDHIYNQNDTIMILNCDDPDNDFVAILTKIIKAVHQGCLHIIVEVQWYYKKNDLPTKYANVQKFIGENEVFLTEHKDLTNVECINGSCKIVSFEEYESLTGIPTNTFYSRSSYDTLKKKISPPVEEWTKICICNSPINPDLLYIQCDSCSLWHHTDCVGVTEEQLSKIEQFLCKKCKGN